MESRYYPADVSKLADCESTFQIAVFRAGTLKTNAIKRRNELPGRQAHFKLPVVDVSDSRGMIECVGWEEARYDLLSLRLLIRSSRKMRSD